MRKLLVIIATLGACFLCPSGISAQCVPENKVFGDGETVVYTASYNWGPVWIDAGLVTFRVNSVNHEGTPAFHLKATGKTFASYDLLFKVRDYYESWIDQKTMQPLAFKRHIYEGGYSLLNTLQFDYPRNRVISATRSQNNPQRNDTLGTRYCGFDMLSAIYYTRTLDFGTMKPGAMQHVPVLIDDAWYDIYIRMIGRETVESKEGRQYRCLKFAAKMVHGTIFKGDEDVIVWVTDDDNKIPVYVEAKIIVGTVKAWLKETKGLRNPFTAIIQE